MTEPGWFPDPQMPAQLRWWDGSSWTSHVATPTAAPAASAPDGSAPAAPPGPAPAAPFGAPGPVAPTPTPGRSSATPWVIGAVAVVLVIGAIAVAFAVTSGRGGAPTVASPTTTARRSTTTEAVGPTSTGPSGPTELSEQADHAGIPVLDEEGSATHTHTLLKIFVGEDDQVVIPAGIGIDVEEGQIAAVHTHADTGVLHVESPRRNDVYTLGQFFRLWGVADTEDELCTSLGDGPCSVTVEVVAPSASDEIELTGLGRVPARPPIDAAGLDTELAQGAVIEVHLDPAS